jgi:hypothetical protein
MGYGKRAIQALNSYYSGEYVDVSESSGKKKNKTQRDVNEEEVASFLWSGEVAADFSLFPGHFPAN